MQGKMDLLALKKLLKANKGEGMVQGFFFPEGKLDYFIFIEIF